MHHRVVVLVRSLRASDWLIDRIRTAYSMRTCHFQRSLRTSHVYPSFLHFRARKTLVRILHIWVEAQHPGYFPTLSSTRKSFYWAHMEISIDLLFKPGLCDRALTGKVENNNMILDSESQHPIFFLTHLPLQPQLCPEEPVLLWRHQRRGRVYVLPELLTTGSELGCGCVLYTTYVIHHVR